MCLGSLSGVINFDLLMCEAPPKDFEDGHVNVQRPTRQQFPAYLCDPKCNFRFRSPSRCTELRFNKVKNKQWKWPHRKAIQKKSTLDAAVVSWDHESQMQCGVFLNYSAIVKQALSLAPCKFPLNCGAEPLLSWTSRCILGCE